MITARLEHPADVAGWRTEARRLLAAGVAPHEVHWVVSGAEDGRGGLAGGRHGGEVGQTVLWTDAADDRQASAPAQGGSHDLFDAASMARPGRHGADDRGAGHGDAGEPAPSHLLRVPADFLAMAQQALLHRDPQRFALLYRLVHRLGHEPGLRHDPLDPDMAAARSLAQGVRRDLHKMKAFVRFSERPAPPGSTAGPLFVAWFEPEHHIVEAVAPFFMRRFTQMHWALVTPERSAMWDGQHLVFGRGASKAEVATPDAQEDLWLTYYAHIFNPARLKLAAMQSEMPRKYWRNLPEAKLIAPLAAQAHQRMDRMIDQEATTPRKKRPQLPPVTVALGGSAQQAAARCLVCPHAQHATQTVWGEGPGRASVMLVGEQPGDQEDLQGRPFVGPAGQLLAQALAAVGLEREQLYLTNAVKHFRFELRGKRRMHKTPGQREVQACAGWLDHEIAEVAPQRLVALGATAAQALMGRPVGIQAHRGRWLTRDDGRPVLITWHPAALLRMPPDERESAYGQWVEDLRAIAAGPGTPEGP